MLSDKYLGFTEANKQFWEQIMQDHNLRMPAEWEKQAAIWLAFPHSSNDFYAKMESVKWAYAEIIRNIATTARVRLLVRSKKEIDVAATFLQKADTNFEQIDFIIAPTNRGWLRDSGGIFVYNGKQKTLLDWHFNAWAKYKNWQKDDRVPLEMAKYLGVGKIQPTHNGKRITLEGGSIDVNGKGDLLTTEECLMSQDIQCRNKNFSKADYEQIFAKYLGATNVIWLGNGIVGDDTHGHVDDITRFVNADTIVTAIETNKNDENYAPLKDNLKRLQKATLANGKSPNIIELPMPKTVIFDGNRLPASYANFLIVNDVVLAPVFNDANDHIALNILAEVFKGKQVIGIYCRDFVIGQGTIHCASQQECL